MTKKVISDFRKIFLDIYLIGYPTEGKSIVCCLYTDSTLSPFLFTSVIDCYRSIQSNYTIELLDRLGIKKLDLLCWTHPDKDHSLGIDELLQNYTNGDTIVAIPISLLENREKFGNEFSQKYCEMIQNRLKVRKPEKKLRLQYTCNNTEVYIRDYLSSVQDKEYRLRIKALAPNSVLVANLMNRKRVSNNIFSIVLCVQFEKLNALFTGDIENTTIQSTKDCWDLPDNFHYIKIPHHGSSSSSALIDFLEVQKNPAFIGNVACSTVFAKAKIPEKEILERYGHIVEKVICTSDIIGSAPAAIIHSRFDVDKLECCTDFYDLE